MHTIEYHIPHNAYKIIEEYAKVQQLWLRIRRQEMKLLLADDHTLFRDALVQYIQRSDIKASISVAKSLGEALSILKKDPDQSLVILDFRMPGMHGMEGFKHMREKYPNIPTALISGMAEEEDVKRAFELGAVGYFPKTMSGKSLLQAIKTVLGGAHFRPVDQDANTLMPAYYDDGEYKSSLKSYGGLHERNSDIDTAAAADKASQLTPREKEVLSHLACGLSNKEIANILGLQVVTVKLHVRGICRKLNVKNRTQAALKAHGHGSKES